MKLNEFIASSQHRKLLCSYSLPYLIVLLIDQVSEVLELVLSLLDGSKSGGLQILEI